MGRLRPVMLKSLPLTAAALTLTSVPPVLVRVSCWLPLFPTAILPKLMVEMLALSIPGVWPLPESATASEELEASLAILRVPVLLPPEAGANCRLKLALCPGASVMGRLSPETLKPDPVVDTCEIVTLDPPELVTVSG